VIYESNRQAAIALRQIVQDHHTYRSQFLNLCAAEGVSSALTREMFASDLSRRYWSPNGEYTADKYIAAMEEVCEDMAARLFGSKFAVVTPVTGHIAFLAAVYALTDPGDRVMMVPGASGGYAASGFLAKSQLERCDFPFDRERWNIKVEEARQAITNIKPELVVFGASTFLFPHPLHELIATCREVGAAVIYDGAHVLGLIAGGQFQDPLGDGVDALVASTNKSFPGPHKGLVLVREDSDLHDRIHKMLVPAPYFQSNHQVHHVAGLAVTLAEMLEFGQTYASQIVANSQALARSLDAKGVALLGRGHGLTQSHQVVLDTGGLVTKEAVRISKVLEEAGISADVVVRLGTASVTRLGMKEPEMVVIGGLIADLIHGTRTPEEARSQVRELATSFAKVHFSFEEDEEAFAYPALSHLNY
jgi:glycine hydroxymethyltransferase